MKFKYFDLKQLLGKTSDYPKKNIDYSSYNLCKNISKTDLLTKKYLIPKKCNLIVKIFYN